MTQPENQAEALDEMGLRAASKEYNASLDGKHFGATERIVRTYLASLPEAPAVPVVNALRPLPSPGEEAERYRLARGHQWAAVFDALRDYRMSNMAWEDGEPGYPLVDLLSRDGNGVTITDGEFEIVSITDEIFAALASQHAVEGEAVGFIAQCAIDRLPISSRETIYSRAEDINDAVPLYARPAAADAGVREALDILDGLDADIGLLKTAVEADDPKTEIKIRFGDIGATIRNLRSSLSLAAKRKQAR